MTVRELERRLRARQISCLEFDAADGGGYSVAG